jgi:hypothetical protein
MTATTYSTAFDAKATTGPFAPPRPCRSMLDYPAFAWQAASDRLTEWVVARMVVHPEVYLSYQPPFTIRRHFCHDFNVHMIWLLPVSPQGMSQWFVIRVNHECDDPKEKVRVNWQAASGWYEELHRRGFTPLLLDNNGGKDIEIIGLLTEEVPASRVIEFVQRFVGDYAAHGLAQVPEFMPNHTVIQGDYAHRGWRVFGVDPSYRYCTRVWNGERWLEREEAIEAILSVTGDSPELLARSESS